MSNGIGKIIAKLKQLKPKWDHPIMGLLHARSGRVSRPEMEYPSDLFQDLAAIPALDMQRVAQKLSNKDFFASIGVVKKYFSFSAERFTAEFLFLTNKEKRDEGYWTTAVVSDMLGYAIALNQDEQLFQNELFEMMMDALAVLWTSSLGDACFFLFEQIMALYLGCEGYSWDVKAVNSFSRYIVDDRALGVAASPYIARFLVVLSERGCCDYSSLVEVVRMCLVEGRELIAPDDLNVIVGAVNTLLGKLNLAAIEIVAISSRLGIYPVTENCFVVMTTMMISTVCDMEPCLLVDKQMKQAPKRRLTEPVFDENPIAFLELSAKSFENGVSKGDIPVVSVLDIPRLGELRTFLLTLTKALSSASPAGVRIVMKTMVELGYMWKETEHKYDGLFALLTFANELAELVDLSQLLDYLCDPDIFDHAYTVFDENLPQCLSLLRNMIVTAFVAKMDASMTELVTRNEEHPVLAAEIMGRFADTKARTPFMSPKCMLSILKVSWSLLQWYDEMKAPVFLQALHTSLYFLFSLIEELDSHQDLYANLFQSKEFIRGYVGMVFVEVLRPMVLTQVRDFLAKSTCVSPEYLCDYVYNLINICKDLEDKRCEDLVCSISDTLTYSLSHNMELVSSFKPVLQAMLDYAASKPSLIIMDSSMKFLNLMIQKTADFHLGSTHIRQLVNVIQKVGVSDSVLLRLMNLCASATSLGNRALFLIKQPSVIPIAFAAFGKSDKLRDLTSYFIDLCNFSPSNCVECHKSGIDEIFLDFIRELRWNNSKQVSFRGFAFELNFEEGDIDELLFPFLSHVIHRVSNNVIAQKFLNLILETKYPETALSVANFMNNKLTNMANRMRPVFALGQKEVCCQVRVARDQLFEKKLSFAFWMKLDQPVSYQVQGSVPILCIKNVNDEAEEFSVSLNRGVIYIGFKKTNTSLEVKTRLCSNTWMFFAFVTRTFGQSESSSAVFIGGQFEFAVEGEPISFSPEATLDITVGGKGDGSVVALLGPFILTHTVYSEEQLQEMETRGPSCLTDEEFFVLKTCESGQLCEGVPDTVCSLCRPYEYRDSLSAVLKEYNHDMTFIDLFRRLESAPEQLIEIAIGIMKYSLDPVMPYAGIIKYYLTKYSSSRLTYSLYLALYSLTDVSRSELLFDNLIVSYELWSLSPAMCFARVVHHWSNTVIYAHPGMFERPRYFSRLLKMFDIMFVRDGLKDRYNEAEIKKLHKSFLGFITAAGKVNLDRRDVEFLFQLAYETTNTEVKVELINLCEILAPSILECAPKVSDLFHSFIDSTDIDVIIAAVHALHQLAAKHLHRTMLTLTMQLATLENKKQVYEVISNEIDSYPGLIVIACGLALSMDYESQLNLLRLLESVAFEQEAVEPLLKDSMWFLTPVVLFTRLTPDVLYGLLWFVANCICLIPDENDRRRSFHCIVATLMFLHSVVDFDFYGCVIGLMSAIDARLEGHVTCFINDCFVAGFARFSESNTSPSLLREFEKSPYVVSPDPVERFVIKDLLTLEEIVNRDFSAYAVHFALVVDDSGHLEQDGILQMACQFIRSVDFHTIQKRCSYLVQFANYLVVRSNKQASMTAEKLVELTEKLEDVIDVLDKKLSRSIALRLELIQKAIKEAKALVCTDHQAIQSKCGKYRNAVQRVRASGPVTDQRAVKAYIMHRQSMADLTGCKKKRSLELCAHLVPSKLRLVVQESEADELLSMSNSKGQMVQWSATSTIVASFSVKWHQFGEVIPQHFDLTKEMFVIHRSLRVSKVVALKDVDMILPRGKNAIEIFVVSDCSIYLDVSPKTASAIIQKFRIAHQRFGYSETSIIRRFLASAKTNFDYLMIHSIFSGRSFHVPDTSPTLPIFDVKDPLSETATEVSADQFFLPELIDETPNDAYQKRMQLEESDIAVYAAHAFRDLHKRVQIPDTKRTTPFSTHVGEMDSAGFLGEKMMFIRRGDSIVFEPVDENPTVFAETHVPGITSIFAGSEAVVVVTSANTIRCVRMQIASRPVEINVRMSMCTCDGGTFAFVGNECSVYVARINDLGNYKRLIKSTRRIDALAINEASKIVVYGTDDYKLMVHSLLTGEPTAVVDLNGNETERILIGPSWGEILVLSNGKVNVYSINGTFIHTINITSAIKEWHAFADTHGSDCLIFTDSRNRIGVCEIMKPKRARYHPSRITHLAAIQFSVSEGGVFAITNSGSLTFLPLQIA